MTDKKNILIAEDEKPLAKVMQLKLKHAGYDVAVVGDGQEALTWLESNTVDLILLDLMMPNLDGFGTLEKIKEKGINVPVIVMSNLSQEADIKRAKDLGAKDFFLKSNMPMSQLVEYIGTMMK